MTERLFRVYFKDSNISLYGGETMIAVLNYLVHYKKYRATDILRIEEVMDDEENE